MDEADGVFYHRGRGGTVEPMRWDDVRDLFLTTEDRMARIRLLVLYLRRTYERAKEIKDDPRLSGVRLKRFDVDMIVELMLASAPVLASHPRAVEELQDFVEAARNANTGLDRIARGNADQWSISTITDNVNAIMVTYGVCENLLDPIVAEFDPSWSVATA
jgi:hypothetical protein